MISETVTGLTLTAWGNAVLAEPGGLDSALEVSDEIELSESIGVLLLSSLIADEVRRYCGYSFPNPVAAALKSESQTNLQQKLRGLACAFKSLDPTTFEMLTRRVMTARHIRFATDAEASAKARALLDPNAPPLVSRESIIYQNNLKETDYLVQILFETICFAGFDKTLSLLNGTIRRLHFEDRLKLAVKMIEKIKESSTRKEQCMAQKVLEIVAPKMPPKDLRTLTEKIESLLITTGGPEAVMAGLFATAAVMKALVQKVPDEAIRSRLGRKVLSLLQDDDRCIRNVALDVLGQIFSSLPVQERDAAFRELHRILQSQHVRSDIRRRASNIIRSIS